MPFASHICRTSVVELAQARGTKSLRERVTRSKLHTNWHDCCVPLAPTFYQRQFGKPAARSSPQREAPITDTSRESHSTVEFSVEFKFCLFFRGSMPSSVFGSSPPRITFCRRHLQGPTTQSVKTLPPSEDRAPEQSYCQRPIHIPLVRRRPCQTRRVVRNTVQDSKTRKWRRLCTLQLCKRDVWSSRSFPQL